MFQTFRNAWKIPELKSRLLFTLGILIVYRLGSAIPVPFVSGDALTAMFANGSMLTYLDMMSGGALSRCTIFALGVTPYINASIIVQLLCFAIPYLENLAKESDGQNKIRQITRYVGGGIALVLSIGYYFLVRNMGALKYTAGAAGVFTAIVVILTFTAGAQLTTWCGEQIDDKGIGNGVSLIIFASIVSNWSSVTTMVADMLTRASSGQPLYYVLLPLLVVMALAVVVFIVIMTNAERRITIQYARRVVGRKQIGGQNSYLPLKVNMSGVMPIIFASTFCSIPGTIGSFINVDPVDHPILYALFSTFNYTSWLYVVIYVLLIVAFNYFYVSIQSPQQRLDPRLPPRQADQRFHHQDAEQDHHDRRHLPGACGCTAHHPGQSDRRGHPAGRHQYADRRWRGTGHHPQPGQLYDHAQPQRFPGLMIS